MSSVSEYSEIVATPGDTERMMQMITGIGRPNFYAYSHPRPDFSPENAVRFKPPAASWSLAIGMRPRSRGAIHLTGQDPVNPVAANFLGDPQDLSDLKAGLRMAREIGNSAALGRFRDARLHPALSKGWS